MIKLADFPKSKGQVTVTLDIVDDPIDGARFAVSVEDRLGCPIARAQGSLRDLVNLMITTRERLDLGSVVIEAAPGWSGYWFSVDDRHAAMVEPKAFRTAVETLEAESQVRIRSRFRLS